MVERFHKDYNNGMDSSFSMHFGELGWTTNPQSADQISELGNRLNEGVKNVEVGALSQDIFGSIPAQHMNEMRRLSKLTDTRLSVHAPLTDPAGFSQQGWGEHERKMAEQEFKDVIDRSYQLDPDGNIPVNFHSSGGGVPAAIWEKKEKDEKEGKQLMTVVNTETGEIKPLRKEEIDWLTSDKKELTPEGRLESLNDSSWEQQKMGFLSLQKQKEETNKLHNDWRLHSQEGRRLLDLEMRQREGTKLSQEEQVALHQFRQTDKRYDDQKEQFDSFMMSHLNDIYNNWSRSYKPKTEEEKWLYKQKRKELEHISKKYKEQIKIQKDTSHKFSNWLNKNKNKNDKEIMEHRKKILEKMSQKIKSKGEVTPELISNSIIDLPTPELYRPVDDVAAEKAAETFANVAMHGYNKYTKKGKNAPLITVENVYPEWTLSRADSLKKMIVDSKKQFVDKLVKKENIDKDRAKKIAEKAMGVTWDVGHINMLRKYGYTKEDIAKEAKKIAKHVKHLHLTDNFGYADTHLALGMGNVPIKEQVEAIEKAGFEGRSIVEGGGMFQHFKTGPIPNTVEGLNSPFYSYDQGPSWTDVRDIYSSYLFGYGDILPEQHFKTQGAGFSMLPKELGGQTGGGDKGNFAQ